LDQQQFKKQLVVLSVTMVVRLFMSLQVRVILQQHRIGLLQQLNMQSSAVVVAVAEMMVVAVVLEQ
jgi:hypothetical protein